MREKLGLIDFDFSFEGEYRFVKACDGEVLNDCIGAMDILLRLKREENFSFSLEEIREKKKEEETYAKKNKVDVEKVYSFCEKNPLTGSMVGVRFLEQEENYYIVVDHYSYYGDPSLKQYGKDSVVFYFYPFDSTIYPVSVYTIPPKMEGNNRVAYRASHKQLSLLKEKI